MERRCKDCGEVISAGRIEALPTTETCVKCSDAKPLTIDDVPVDGADNDELVRIVGRTAQGER